MDLDPEEWLTIRKLAGMIVALLILYLTLWTLYFIGYFPAAHNLSEKGSTTEPGTSEPR
jgi:hypothetical protein